MQFVGWRWINDPFPCEFFVMDVYCVVFPPYDFLFGCGGGRKLLQVPVDNFDLVIVTSATL